MPAHAGHYSVSYSGGSVTTNGYSGSHTTPYALDNNSFWGASGTGGWYAPYYPSGGASGGGAITATLTWVGDDPTDLPPQSLFVAEEAHADWSASSSGYSSASCDNGAGSAPTQSGQSGGSDGFRYSVQQSPGPSFTITCSPSVSITGGSGSGYGTATVSYRVTSVIPTIAVAGTTQVSSNPSVLIGQGLNAVLSLGNATQSNWQWSIAGADPFAGFQVTANTGHALELTAAMMQQANLHWYYRSIGNADGPVDSTISCTATITDPNGVQHQASASTKVKVYKPTHQLFNTPGTTGIWDVGQGTLVLGPGNPNAGHGMEFRGRVQTPSDFETGEELGSWALAQIVTSNASYTDENGTDHQSPINGKTGLDDQFTYGGLAFPDGGIFSTSGDSPSLSLQQKVIADLSASFQTFMLYRPPDVDGATGTTWVPLHEVDWNFSGSAIRNVNTGLWRLLNSSGVTVTLDQPTSTLPSWTQVIHAVNF